MREEVRRGWWDRSLLDELEALIAELTVPIGVGLAKQ